ncbi:unnamed protein product [Nesidiocoris tenuis]|uniref:RNase NYN domain-containing protein n=1 Tax=Nesidiocoris tenuis TaxID=355587 RepID=A0A6H5GL26_9HEMI|nr:unnamed protein product [Nesidiocoris tenuis]
MTREDLNKENPASNLCENDQMKRKSLSAPATPTSARKKRFRKRSLKRPRLSGQMAALNLARMSRKRKATDNFQRQLNAKKIQKRNSVIVIDSEESEADVSVVEIIDASNSIIELSDDEIGVCSGSLSAACQKGRKPLRAPDWNGNAQLDNKTANDDLLTKVDKPNKGPDVVVDDQTGRYIKRQHQSNPESSTGPSKNAEIYQPLAGSSDKKTGLRPVVIDGCNVAFGPENLRRLFQETGPRSDSLRAAVPSAPPRDDEPRTAGHHGEGRHVDLHPEPAPDRRENDRILRRQPANRLADRQLSRIDESPNEDEMRMRGRDLSSRGRGDGNEDDVRFIERGSSANPTRATEFSSTTDSGPSVRNIEMTTARGDAVRRRRLPKIGSDHWTGVRVFQNYQLQLIVLDQVPHVKPAPSVAVEVGLHRSRRATSSMETRQVRMGRESSRARGDRRGKATNVPERSRPRGSRQPMRAFLGTSPQRPANRERENIRDSSRKALARLNIPPTSREFSLNRNTKPNVSKTRV